MAEAVLSSSDTSEDASNDAELRVTSLMKSTSPIPPCLVAALLTLGVGYALPSRGDVPTVSLTPTTSAAAPVGSADPADTPLAEPLVVNLQGDLGGRLVVPLAAEPRTLNPLLATDRPSFTVVHQLHASLVHIDGLSQRTVPALASSWQSLDDGRRLRLQLRRGVRFSDGEPFDADDVLFTFQVYSDPAVASPNRDLLMVAGEPVRVEKLDSHRIDLVFAAPYAVGERLLDGLAILPRHRLQAAYAEGTLSQQWGLSSSPDEIVGLGPFRLVAYLPGERLELERNPHYWKTDINGQRLPYLDRLSLLFVSNPESSLLRFESGELHLLDGLSGETFDRLSKSRQRAHLDLRDLGPGLSYSFLFFNLNPPTPGAASRRSSRYRWFENQIVRQAVSAAIDRDSIIRLVYRGRATAIGSHVTSGNKLWINRHLPVPRRSLDQARQLLNQGGFSWRDDGTLQDDRGEAVAFTLITSSSNQQRLDMATLLQRDLRDLGITMQIVPLEFRALIERLTHSLDYEACLLALGGGDIDPNGSLNVWQSSGGNHLWHLGQTQPATPWEAEIDSLLRAQLVAVDPVVRKALYDRLQAIVAEQLPFIFLVSPNTLVGARREVGNFAPSILGHPTLWNADALFLHPPD